MIPYKLNNTSDVAQLMDRYLRIEASDTRANDLSEALDCIGRAAEIFDGLQDVQASEAITVLIEKLAGH
jgi:hypothetical protein